MFALFHSFLHPKQRKNWNSARKQQTQYLFNIQQTESEYLTRKNKIQSNINEAYNAIPSLGSTLLNIGTGALSSYTNAFKLACVS